MHFLTPSQRLRDEHSGQCVGVDKKNEGCRVVGVENGCSPITSRAKERMAKLAPDRTFQENKNVDWIPKCYKSIQFFNSFTHTLPEKMYFQGYI